MPSPRPGQCTRDRARAPRARSAALALPLLALLACGGAQPLREIATPETVEFTPEDVRVRLVFGAEADLDLIVTDPNHEEIYFANTQSRLGGLFDADQRCDSPAPRVETVSFNPAPVGRYRVSVDFMIRCAPGVDEVPYRLVIEANGETSEIEGLARFGVLEQVAHQFAAKPVDPEYSEWEEGELEDER